MEIKLLQKKQNSIRGRGWYNTQLHTLDIEVGLSIAFHQFNAEFLKSSFAHTLCRDIIKVLLEKKMNLLQKKGDQKTI